MTKNLLSFMLSILLCLARLFAVFRPLLYALAFFLSALAMVGVPGRIKVVWRNLQLVYPSQTRLARLCLLFHHYWSLGQGGVEALLVWAMPDAWWHERLSWVGEAAVDSEKGVVILTPHLHTFEILPKAMHVLGRKIGLVFQSNHDMALDAHVKSLRSCYATCFTHKEVLLMWRWLKQGGILGALPDQHMRGVDVVRVPFLGVDCWTITGPIRLAQASGAKLMTTYCRRKCFAKSYELIFSDALDQMTAGDVTQAVAKMNAMFSEWIHKVPEQYYWMHRRFKD